MATSVLCSMKGWRTSPIDFRPRAWRWEAKESPALFQRELHTGQVPLYAHERSPAWVSMVCVGHTGYLDQATREAKAETYRKSRGPLPPTINWQELLTNDGVRDFDWQNVAGVP